MMYTIDFTAYAIYTDYTDFLSLIVQLRTTKMVLTNHNSTHILLISPCILKMSLQLP